MYFLGLPAISRLHANVEVIATVMWCTGVKRPDNSSLRMTSVLVLAYPDAVDQLA